MHAGEPLDLEVEVTRTEFETAASPLLERARTLVFAALDKAKLTVADIDKVLLVGGPTYLPCVQSMLKEVFGEAVRPAAFLSPDIMQKMTKRRRQNPRLLQTKGRRLCSRPLPSQWFSLVVTQECDRTCGRAIDGFICCYDIG